MVTLMERYQVVLYLLALGAGTVASFVSPLAALAHPLVTPALGLLLLATFLPLPLRGLLEPGALSGVEIFWRTAPFGGPCHNWGLLLQWWRFLCSALLLFRVLVGWFKRVLKMWRAC